MGVAVGLGLAVTVTVGVAVTDLVTVGVTVTVGDALAVADEPGLGVSVARLDDPVPALDVLPGDLPCDAGTVAVPLATAVGADAPPVAVPTDGEKIEGTVEPPPPLQADTDAESRTVTAAQPAAVSLALLALIGPPCVPGWRRLNLDGD
jgi:hypothetical protein